MKPRDNQNILGVQVSDIQPKDWRKFHRLFKKIINEDFGAYPEKMRLDSCKARNIKKGLGAKKVILVAKNKAKIVGFLIGVSQPSGLGFINWLAVKKESRGLGIGNSLIQTWQKKAKAMGCHKLCAETSNLKNKTFYEKMGFCLEGEKKQDKYGMDYLIFGKIIGVYKNN